MTPNLAAAGRSTDNGGAEMAAFGGALAGSKSVAASAEEATEKVRLEPAIEATRQATGRFVPERQVQGSDCKRAREQAIPGFSRIGFAVCHVSSYLFVAHRIQGSGDPTPMGCTLS